MTARGHDYTDDLGEMDTIGAAPVADLLPPPAELAEHADTVKVTVVARNSVDQFLTGFQASRSFAVSHYSLRDQRGWL